MMQNYITEQVNGDSCKKNIETKQKTAGNVDKILSYNLLYMFCVV